VILKNIETCYDIIGGKVDVGYVDVGHPICDEMHDVLFRIETLYR
jgi:hypothetical protein